MKVLRILATLVTMIMTFGSRGAFAEPLKVGQPAPDFNLPDQNGKNHELSDYHGKWLALFFYVKDDTPGCTKQACKFRDDIHQLRDLGAEVVGISVDDSASHAHFAKKYSLPFPLLADSKGETARHYDSMWASSVWLNAIAISSTPKAGSPKFIYQPALRAILLK